ncbi:MAG: TIGR04282 family arsenosugar biosynthesis glycosyltransferase [Nevskiales bacterium]|nr:TIGR04282 family arsenosugar biosynthesis glycosyltransferase [Nevskiales bacterium]
MRLKVLIFSRAPIPGRCKTRLIPALGPPGAARLHRRLVTRTLRTSLDALRNRAGGFPVPSTPQGREAFTSLELWCAPNTRHPFFQACRREFGVRLRRQARGDLGRRMALALSRALNEGADAAVLMGTDCPALSSADLHSAFDALAMKHDCVLLPSTDGGYVLIGARKIQRRVLAGIAWSSGHELAQTRCRLKRAGLRWSEGPIRSDVDTPADYRRARRAGWV